MDDREISNKINKLHGIMGRHEERLMNLEGYREKQNGHLKDLNAKMDKIYNMLLGALATFTLALIIFILNFLGGGIG